MITRVNFMFDLSRVAHIKMQVFFWKPGDALYTRTPRIHALRYPQLGGAQRRPVSQGGSRSSSECGARGGSRASRRNHELGLTTNSREISSAASGLYAAEAFDDTLGLSALLPLDLGGTLHQCQHQHHRQPEAAVQRCPECGSDDLIHFAPPLPAAGHLAGFLHTTQGRAGLRCARVFSKTHRKDFVIHTRRRNPVDQIKICRSHRLTLQLLVVAI